MLRDLSRRQFLASVGGAAVLGLSLPPNLQKVLGTSPGSHAELVKRAGPLSKIEHVVVLMQENRSFDHYFGALPGVRGFADKSVAPRVFYQPDPENPSNYLLPFHVDTQTSSAQALPSGSHDWGPQHQSWNNGAMDGFVTAHLAADGSDGQYTMAYYNRNDIPFHWALADAFTVCDGYHSSMLGPTWPNRLYLMTGMVDPEGLNGGPVYSNSVPPNGFTWETYPEMLTAAGIPWRVYQENDNYALNPLEFFGKYQNASTSSELYQNGMRFYQPGQFEYDATHDKLPTVSWILPPSYQSEHPEFLPAAGADFVASKIDAIAANPDVWAKTVFILNYDENDGFFDHVTPPTAPSGTAGEYISVDGISQPIGLGFRVPCVVVSPWTVGGYVCHDTFDHTSVIRLIERLTGVYNPNISRWRRNAVGDLTSALGAGPSYRVPRLPTTGDKLMRAEQEVATFGLPPIPGAAQKFPTQDSAVKPTPRNTPSSRQGAN